MSAALIFETFDCLGIAATSHVCCHGRRYDVDELYVREYHRPTKASGDAVWKYTDSSNSSATSFVKDHVDEKSSIESTHTAPKPAEVALKVIAPLC